MDEIHPCPHCGNNNSLTDRQDNEFRSIFSNEIQSDYNNSSTNYQTNRNYSENYGQRNKQNLPDSSPLKLYTDLPLEFLFPQGVRDSMLPITEQKLYLQLSLEFRIILDKAQNYQEGMRNWTVVLPERLQAYGLTREVWDRISSQGDNDQMLQEELRILIRKIFR